MKAARVLALTALVALNAAPRVHGAFLETFTNQAGCTANYNDATDVSGLHSNFAGFSSIAPECYPRAAPSGNALVVDCTSGQGTVYEMNGVDDCFSDPATTAVASWTPSVGDGSECMAGAAGAGSPSFYVRLSCTAASPLAANFFAVQTFQDPDCMNPPAPSASDLRGVQTYDTMYFPDWQTPQCDAGEKSFVGVDGGQLVTSVVRVTYLDAACTSATEFDVAENTPMGKCLPFVDFDTQVRYRKYTAPTATLTDPTKGTQDTPFAPWPPVNSIVKKQCADMACTSEPVIEDVVSTAIYLRCNQDYTSLSCRGDFQSVLTHESQDCTSVATLTAAVRTALGSKDNTADDELGTFDLCSSPAAGETPAVLPPIAIVQHVGSCAGEVSSIQFRTSALCRDRMQVTATGTTISVESFSDDVCGTSTGTEPLADQACVEPEYMTFTSASSCNVADLDFRAYAGWTADPDAAECAPSSSSSTGEDSSSSSSAEDSSSSTAEDSSSSSSAEESSSTAEDSSSSSSAEESSSSSTAEEDSSSSSSAEDSSSSTADSSSSSSAEESSSTADDSSSSSTADDSSSSTADESSTADSSSSTADDSSSSTADSSSADSSSSTADSSSSSSGNADGDSSSSSSSGNADGDSSSSSSSSGASSSSSSSSSSSTGDDEPFDDGAAQSAASVSVAVLAATAVLALVLA